MSKRKTTHFIEPTSRAEVFTEGPCDQEDTSAVIGGSERIEGLAKELSKHQDQVNRILDELQSIYDQAQIWTEQAAKLLENYGAGRG